MSQYMVYNALKTMKFVDGGRQSAQENIWSECACADMARDFGMNNGAKLTDVFQAFHKERESGFLLHYWP